MKKMTRRGFVKSGAIGVAAATVLALDVVEASGGSASAATEDSLSPQSLAALSTVVDRQLQGWTSWLTRSGAKGVVSECGWPNRTAAPSEATAWNDVARSWLTKAAAAETPVLSWGSGRVWAPTYLIGALTAQNPKTYISTTQSNARLMANVLGKTHTWGTNLSGGERSSVQSGTGTLLPIVGGGVFSNGNPGKVGVDYFYPTQGDLRYCAAAGVRIVRLPIRWERIQPELSGPLNPMELGLVLAALVGAGKVGMKMVPELHNGAAYVVKGASITTGKSLRLGYRRGTLTASQFVDFWTRFAKAVSSHPGAVAGLEAYGLMNEPNTAPEAQALGANLLANGSFSVRTTAGWTPYQSRLQAVKPPAVAALQITSSGGITGAETDFSVTGKQQLALSGAVMAATTPRQWGVQVDWFGADGRWIGQQSGDWPVDSVGKWTTIAAVLAVPAGATLARTRFRSDKALPAGEVHYLSSCTVHHAAGGFTGPQVWEQLSAAAVGAVRAAGVKSKIWVAGHNAQSPVSWLTDHSAGAWISDPLNKTVYDAHHYFDLAAGGAGIYAGPIGLDAAAAERVL
jgi:hypothetical protein